ncbi:unnamed protein product [Ectocarpus sp. 12 AP-2014]
MPAMLVESALIDSQLAKIAAVRSWLGHGGLGPSRGLETGDCHEPKFSDNHTKILSKIFVCWRHELEAKARNRAWRATRNRCTLTKAVALWNAWLQRNRGMDAERAAREALAEAKRLSRALHRFREMCVRRRRTRHLKRVFRASHRLSQRRLQRAWCRWRKLALDIQAKAVFHSWAAATKQSLLLDKAKRAVSASQEAKAMAFVLKLWRSRARASALARLLHAWAVIGPVRKAVGVMRSVAHEARAAERLRFRLLRAGLRQGFMTFLENRRCAQSAAAWAKDHDRTRKLRRSIQRWVVGHSQKVAVELWKHSVLKAKQRTNIKIWVSETTVSKRTRQRALSLCVKRLKQHIVRRRNTRALASEAVKFRRARLWGGLRRWHARSISIQRQQRSNDAAYRMRRARFLRQGLASFSALKQESRAAYRAKVFRRDRCISATISCWRRTTTQFGDQHDLGQSACRHSRGQTLSAGLSFWRRRVARVTRVSDTITRFQGQRGQRVGFLMFRSWMENRRLVRLSMWRAGVWAEAHRARNALITWRSHARAFAGIQTSVRIARHRKQTRQAAQSRCSTLDGYVFRVLRTHARARSLERRVLRAWFFHTESTARASKQVRVFRLRSGLLGLRSWVKSSETRRQRRLQAKTHRNHRVVETMFSTWRNRVHPLGLRAHWGGIRPCTYIEGATKSKATQQNEDLAVGSREMQCLRTTEAATARDWESVAGCSSLLLLRLPMIGQRVRRVLYVWRKRARKEIRFRYIRDTLPKRKVLRPPRISQEREMGLLMGNSKPKGYLQLHMPNYSENKALPTR